MNLEKTNLCNEVDTYDSMYAPDYFQVLPESTFIEYGSDELESEIIIKFATFYNQAYLDNRRRIQKLLEKKIPIVFNYVREKRAPRYLQKANIIIPETIHINQNYYLKEKYLTDVKIYDTIEDYERKNGLEESEENNQYLQIMRTDFDLDNSNHFKEACLKLEELILEDKEITEVFIIKKPTEYKEKGTDNTYGAGLHIKTK